MLTVFVAFGHGVHEVGEGDIHRRPLGKMAQGLGLAWRNRHIDRTGFPGNRHGIGYKTAVRFRGVCCRQIVHGDHDGIVDYGHRR